MSKILANQIANYGDDAPIEIKEGLNIPAGKPIQAAGSAGSAGQVLSTTGTTIQWVSPFDGDYNSLTNTPAIPAAQVNSDWNATSGVARILNKPVVPPQPSVTTNAAGTAALSYNSVNGQFTYTPPDLSGFADGTNEANWDTAYGWGDHAAAGYLTAEADTLETVTGRGYTTTNNIVFNDGVQARFGTLNGVGEGDLRIYHALDGSASVIQEAGGTDLVIMTAGSDILFRRNNEETYAEFHDNGSVDLYYDNDKKFETTTEGVTITGSAGNNNLQVDGDALVIGGLTAGGLSYPEVTGTVGQVLTSDGAGNVLWSAAGGGSGGIALTDLSVTTNAAGSAALTYNNVSGVFTYTPPDLSGYLTSFTETDPVFSVSPAASISTIQINNWNSAYSWGDHSAAGYLTAYTENGTLDDVTSRGASTTNSVSLGGIQLGTLTQLTNSFGNTNTLKFGGDMTIFHMQDGIFGTSNRIIVDEYNLIIGTKGEVPDNYYTNLIEVNVGNDLGSTSNTADVRLGFGNVGTRLQTTAAGVTVTGALTAGGLTYPTSNGTNGQVLTSDGAGNVVWGSAATGNTQVTISDTLPAGTPSAGDLWWESDTGRLKIYYTDTDSSQWVDTNPPLADTNNPAAKGYIFLDGTSPTWTGTAGYTVSGAQPGGAGTDYVITLTFPTAYSARTDYIVQATYDSTNYVAGNGASIGVVRGTSSVVFTPRRWNEDPLSLGEIMVTIYNL